MKIENIVAIAGLAIIVGIGGFSFVQAQEPAGCRFNRDMLNLSTSIIDYHLITGAPVHDQIESKRRTIEKMRQLKCHFDYNAEMTSLSILANNQ